MLSGVSTRSERSTRVVSTGARSNRSNLHCVEQSVFVSRRSARWARLEALLARAGRSGLRTLNAAELFEVGRLYRWLTSELAGAQGHGYDTQLLQYLNRLTGAAYAHIYRAGATSGRARIARFFTHTFPAEFRRSFPQIGLCIALTLLWSAIAYAIVWRTPANAYALLPPELVPGGITKSIHDTNFGFGPQESAAMSSEIITNNIRVSILAFAGGIVTLGALTLYMIIFNALMVGALGALYTHAGFGFDFWATIAPHGFIELTAIQIAGGAGLLIGAAVLVPGRMRRSDALRENGRRAGVLIAGVTAMLCVAGMIEGFFSPLHFPSAVRFSVGVFTGILLLLYFSFAGRERPTLQA